MNNHRPPTQAHPTILLVEDDDIIRDLIILTLSKQNYHVVTANNGRDALARFQAYQPNLVILDILLPWMNGIDVLRYWKDKNLLGGVPVLIISALSHREIVQDAFDAGARDFLIKPFDKNVLLERLQRMLSPRTEAPPSLTPTG
ncbi:MAG TPA: response regulator [Anaerolineales bacterium]|nr:response regulator [Anaerolineales bacterium]